MKRISKSQAENGGRRPLCRAAHQMRAEPSTREGRGEGAGRALPLRIHLTVRPVESEPAWGAGTPFQSQAPRHCRGPAQTLGAPAPGGGVPGGSRCGFWGTEGVGVWERCRPLILQVIEGEPHLRIPPAE